MDRGFAFGLKLVPEALKGETHRPGRGIREGANRPAFHLIAEVKQQIQVAHRAFALVDPRHNVFEPARSLAARRALSAAFV